MLSLLELKYTVQQTAEAIAAALQIEVEIADRNMIRVAGTGRYADSLGQQLEGLVYRHVLATAQPVVIDSPGSHELCRPCRFWGGCPETAEVVVPIVVEQETLGVIGLVGFDTQQASTLLARQESLLIFLEKMADLLAGKVLQHRQEQQRDSMARKLMTVLNLLHDGILVVNEDRMIVHYNEIGARMADIVPDQLTGLQQIMDDKKIWKAVSKGEPFSGQVKGQREAVQWYCDAVPIITDQGVEGAVIVLKDVHEIKRLVQDTTVSDIATDFSQFLGNCGRIRELKELASRVAASNSTLLIQGESGTGKELLARAIHQSSRRRNNAFIAINCGAIPENLLESELFGYEDGSFTGARKGGKLGKFELAQNGTIFLDEIGDIPLHLQVKLLRVLQEKRVERIGGSRSTPVDVRVIAATHRNLEKLVASGEFREDLYYRLNVIPLGIPPLRERREDIPLLVAHYLEHYARVLGKKINGITPDAAAILNRYHWPGNVRELSNVIEYAVTMTSGQYISAEVLPKRIKTEQKVIMPSGILNLKVLEREAIMRALEAAVTEGGKDDAARLLGISRATLYRKIKEYSIAERVFFS